MAPRSKEEIRKKVRGETEKNISGLLRMFWSRLLKGKHITIRNIPRKNKIRFFILFPFIRIIKKSNNTYYILTEIRKNKKSPLKN